MNRPTICTIASNNYLSYARVLTSSFLQHHPDGKVFAMIVDTPDPAIDYTKEMFTTLFASELGIPNFERMSFYYKVTELNTAVKPWFLEQLFQKYDLKKVIYLDPDVLVMQPLTQIFDLLDANNVVLTPHLTVPQMDNRLEDELHILQAGAYNLGFIGLKAGKASEQLLRWWQWRLLRHCTTQPDQGLFVDQKWIDLVPGIFEGVHILQDETCNVAYWNLKTRNVSKRDDGLYLVNSRPITFYHFSGFDPTRPLRISAHSNPVRLKDNQALQDLLYHYRFLQLAHGFTSLRQFPYGYGFFDNGKEISDKDRVRYYALGKSTERLGNPFEVGGDGSFYTWLQHHPLSREDQREDGGWLAKRHEIAPYVSAVRTFRNAVGEKRFHQVVRLLGLAPEKQSGKSAAREKIDELGLNITGYFTTESGVGALARGSALATKAASIPYSLTNLTTSASRQEDAAYQLEFAQSARYPIDLVHVNADQVPVWRSRQPTERSSEYSIGYWTWELSHFPKKWEASFGGFDEIWTLSSFARDAIAEQAPIPVVAMPPAIVVQPDTKFQRKHFGIPDNTFVFLFMFDFLSEFERKNPLAVVSAFREAFSNSEDAHLVIKFINQSHDRANERRLREATNCLPATILDNYYTKTEADSLIATCDTYVSLHRSEGFGLTLAEAMAMGKPVIATNYSGNTDFMNKRNSFLIPYELAKLERNYGPNKSEYVKGNVWAEPNVQEAAAWMRHVYERVDDVMPVVEQAQEDMQKYLPEQAGHRMKQRLERVYGRIKTRV